MLRSLATATALSLVLTGDAPAEPKADTQDVTLFRVFVGDHAAPTITAFDLGDPARRWTFATAGRARLHGIDGGSAVVAVQPDADAVHVIDSGVTLHAHGDHADIAIADPRALGEALTGPRPFHLVEHGGQVAINFDRGGYAAILTSHDLAAGRFDAARLAQSRPHHGVAAPVGKAWVTSVASDAPVADGAAPRRLGLRLVTAEGRPVGDIQPCTDIHGEAFSGAYLATGCREGILTVKAGADGPAFRMLPYPADLPPGETTGTLLGAKGLQVFLGSYGANGLVVVDPTDEPPIRHVELPFRRVDFALDPANARLAFALTEDGTLHRIDMLDAGIVASARVVEPYSMDGDGNEARPRLALAGHEVVMTDPRAGLVRRIDKDTLKETGTIAVEGIPSTLAVVGGSGAVHASGEHAAHAHAHADPKIYAGYFEDAQIEDRPLSDYAGDWQSIYPYLRDGTLDPVWEHKAQKGAASVETVRTEYETGYRTDVDRITIKGDVVTFHRNGRSMTGTYAYDGRETLTYKKGNRGVRFIFAKTGGDAQAPKIIQFSDHGIAPAKAGHFHLYWGDDRAALLREVTNWPTFYPSSLAPNEIVAEMLAH